MDSVDLDISNNRTKVRHDSVILGGCGPFARRSVFEELVGLVEHIFGLLVSEDRRIVLLTKGDLEEPKGARQSLIIGCPVI